MNLKYVIKIIIEFENFNVINKQINHGTMLWTWNNVQKYIAVQNASSIKKLTLE